TTQEIRKPASDRDNRGATSKFTRIAAQDLERLLALRHSDPHSILGAHPTAEGLVVRAFRPAAERVDLLLDGGPPKPMARRHEDGLFEALVPDQRDVTPYNLQVTYPGGKVYTVRSPYSFLPTLGDLDLHLWAEGKHERAYEKL